MESRVTVGRIGRAHGLDGEFFVISESDSPDRFRAGSIFETDEPNPRRVEVRKSRRHQGRILVALEGIEDRTLAEALRGVGLTIGFDQRRHLGADEFWPDQLVGLSVTDPAGNTLGTVAGVEADEPQARLVVLTDDGNRNLVPFVRELVPEVRLPDGPVVVRPIDGLFSSSPD